MWLLHLLLTVVKQVARSAQVGTEVPTISTRSRPPVLIMLIRMTTYSAPDRRSLQLADYSLLTSVFIHAHDETRVQPVTAAPGGMSTDTTALQSLTGHSQSRLPISLAAQLESIQQ
jgi:hypothetical protein